MKLINMQGYNLSQGDAEYILSGKRGSVCKQQKGNRNKDHNYLTRS